MNPKLSKACRIRSFAPPIPYRARPPSRAIAGGAWGWINVCFHFPFDSHVSIASCCLTLPTFPGFFGLVCQSYEKSPRTTPAKSVDFVKLTAIGVNLAVLTLLRGVSRRRISREIPLISAAMEDPRPEAGRPRHCLLHEAYGRKCGSQLLRHPSKASRAFQEAGSSPLSPRFQWNQQQSALIDIRSKCSDNRHHAHFQGTP